MTKTCKTCTKQFEVTQEDLAFLDKVSPVFNGQKYSIPAPTHCPDCRLQRRLAYRNLRKIYNRKCDLTGKQIVSVFRPDSKFKTYYSKEWDSDDFDATQYGRDFDFSRPFFEQFRELQLDVPKPHLSTIADSMKNSEYVNGAGNCINCYLSFSMSFAEEVHYSELMHYCKNCTDCFSLMKCEICYECLDSNNLYECFWCQDCQNCSSSYFLKDCIGCRDCFGCVNLRNKQYYIYNKKYTKEEYENFIKSLKFTEKTIKEFKQNLRNLYLSLPHKYSTVSQIESSTGNYLTNVKDCFNCYTSGDSQNLKNCFQVRVGGKDSQDITYWGENIELCYEGCIIGRNSYNLLFSYESYNNAYNLIYCDSCRGGKHLFGCVSLKRNEYCILNKQYSKEEYEKLVPKIIEHMKKTGEWGEFFPIKLSPFAYNESLANDYFPLTKEQTLQEGFDWYDYDKKSFYDGPEYTLPESIDEIDETICSKILKCEKTGRSYKIIPQEFEFYKKYGFPIPKICPDARHENRLSQRTGWHLYSRSCQKCGVEVQSCFSENDPEVIYCEKCYLEDVI